MTDLLDYFIDKGPLNPIEHPCPPGFLSDSLRRAGLRSEAFTWRPPADIPEPFRALLVHEGDMTSTLERFHGERMLLEVFAESRSDEYYYREVILKGEASGRAAEFGLIEIQLDQFPTALQSSILLGQQPLGGILNDSGMAYKSKPLGYFSVARAELPAKLSALGSKNTFFGRYNQLQSQDDTCLARILEIVPDSYRP